jgi:hypothetical protein
MAAAAGVALATLRELAALATQDWEMMALRLSR